MSDTEIRVGAIADFASEKIEGFVMGQGWVSTPLFSQIDGNLWMGGCPVESAPREFEFVIDLYTQGEYYVHGNQIHTVAKMIDGSDMPDARVLHALADYVNAVRAIGPTLVHCQAGLNRSGLVTALALMKSGMGSHEAIALLRSKRCDAVLCNTAFSLWLRKLDAPSTKAGL